LDRLQKKVHFSF